MKRTFLLEAVVAAAVSAAPAVRAAGLGAEWLAVRGDWGRAREIIPMVRQGNPKGLAVAFRKTPQEAHGAWRATVEPAIGTRQAGIWVQGDPGLKQGFLVVLGGNPSVGGLALKTAEGKTLWEDKWAPWQPYRPYVVEAIVDRGRIRAQMFEWDARTLISQGPWVPVPETATETPGLLGLTTRDGIARFWGCERADKTLSPIVPDAPNKRRLVQGEQPAWQVIGPGNWMWVTARKQRLRQYAVVERTKAIHLQTRGALRRWECRLKVDPAAGGAGMMFQTNRDDTQGFLAWLGGRPGAGSLMLYQFPKGARWSGKQGNWRYNTEYVLRAETRKGEARVQLLRADGKTVVQDSSWIEVGAAAAREGYLGFHTWRGRADFWGFSEATQVATTATRPDAAQLGGGWQAHGGGAWQWVGKGRSRIRQTAKPKQAIALNTAVTGVKGTWRCRVKVAGPVEAAGLVFQASPDRKLGFACLLTARGARLESLDGKTMWEHPKLKWTPGVDYVLEGSVETDRVSARVLAADGKTVLAASPDIYVPDANNTRRGHLGLLVRGAQAEFRAWGKE